MTTTARLLDLLSLLQTRREWPGSVLASRLDISDRTVRRDIDRLREMGYNIRATMGPEGGYRLDAGSELPPLLFDEDQTAAVAIALQTAPALGAGIEEAAIRALGTIRQVMPSRLRHRLDAFEVTALGRSGDAVLRDVAIDVLVALSNAIRDHETIRFDYGDSGADDESQPPRRVEPHHLVTSGGRWYLVAWDTDRDDWRVFRVDRVRPRSPGGRRFVPRTVPGGDVSAFVAARFTGSDDGGWACRGSVILDLPARRVVPFAGDGIVTPVDDERCRLEAGSWSWASLAAAFARFDAPMEIVGPPELRAAFAMLAERFAATAGARPV